MGALRKWFETHKVHIELPDGRKCMVTAEGFSGDESGAPADMFVYYDFTNQCVFKFDPVKTDQVEIVSDEPMQIADSAFRQSLVESVKDYVGKSYCKGKTLFNIQQGDDENTQTIQISCHNYKTTAFWTGEWLSTWTVQAGQLSGSINAKSHYYEQGNVQFNISKEFDSVPCKDITNGDQVVAAIAKVEDQVSNQKLILQYLSELEKMYEHIGENIMKRMRRAVAVHGQKFDWDRDPSLIL